MGGKAGQESFLWVSEYQEKLFPSLTNLKRKGRSKKIVFDGWGSIPLIEFLHSIGKDTSQPISQNDVKRIIDNYINENKLVNPEKKKRIVSDKKLLSLFGKKSFIRTKICDLLKPHYAENQIESDDDFLISLDEENSSIIPDKQKSRKAPLKKLCLGTSKSCWAAIIPDNIKLVYLKRSLVQDLLKDSETFERKMVGSFVRVKSDPNDYLQKNSHQLLQVTGTKQVCGTNDKSGEILLQVSKFVKDIRISTLSDDNFSKEECEDLCQRVKDGLHKRLTVAELKEKAQILHVDITKHWLVRELDLLQKLINRANEKGWRKEYVEYLERRELLQTPAEQERLLHEIPNINGDEEKPEALSLESPNNMEKGNYDSLMPTPKGASEVPVCDIAVDAAGLPLVSLNTGSIGMEAALLKSKQQTEKEEVHIEFVAEKDPHIEFVAEKDPHIEFVAEKDPHIEFVVEKEPHIEFVTEKEPLLEFVAEPHKQLTERRSQSKVVTPLVEIGEDEIGGGLADKLVIDLSDDEDNEDLKDGNQARETELRCLDWHYTDPQGDIQGPFSIKSLKGWWDDGYFPSDFKVWKSGQGRENAVLLLDVLQVNSVNSGK